MIDLYYWPTPNGWKITILLEELGLPYKMIPVDIGKGEQFEPDFLKISPNNRMPAIVDHDVDGDPVSIFESGAIMLYLAEKTGKFIPSDTAGRVEVLQWLFWQVGGLGPMLGQVSHFNTYAPQLTDSDLSYSLDRYTQEGVRLFGVMDRRLADRDYLAGDYSIADMACWPWVAPAARFGYDMSKHENLMRWIESVGMRPAVERGFAVGEEYRNPQPVLTEESKKILFGQSSPIK